MRLLAHIKQLADGYTLSRTAYNYLRDGIWELKVDRIRVTFYDTDGSGGWAPKQGKPEHQWDGGRWYPLPDFDDYLRLGHSFIKNDAKTLQDDLNASIEIRKADISHDQ